MEAEFESISAACGDCLEVFTISRVVEGEERIPEPVEVVNVIALQRGSTDPDRVVLMSGDLDSRVTDVMDSTSLSPGANDNASGVAGVLEAARLLTPHRFKGSVVYAVLSGEEQGLFGGVAVAEHAVEVGWRVEAVLNNDMIGNIHGIDGVIDNTTVRVFSDGVPPNETEIERLRRRYTGGEVDGVSRQLARYVDVIAERYFPTLDVMLVYRLDRFGRGGHHRPFADLGLPAVRIMETHEHYDRQHQDLRSDDGIEYGDVIEGVDFDYAAKVTALNAATLASLAWSPGSPQNVTIEGAVQPAATLRWQAPVDASDLVGYRLYWRLTDRSTWTHSRWLGMSDEATTDGLVIDNYFFGIAAVAGSGHESAVVFPTLAPPEPEPESEAAGEEDSD